MADDDIGQAKQAFRERVWALMDQEGVSPPPGAHGRIPDFVGSDRAAELLAELPQWRAARVVKANPDRAQLPVRTRALSDGKLLYMAVPRLATPEPFYRIDALETTAPFDRIATGEGAAGYARRVRLNEMRPVDLVVAGSVAVNRHGARIGKGAGYSDIEVALLIEAGLVTPDTLIVTTVHGCQVTDDDLPETAHDFSVDVIVTPDEVIPCRPARRPTGIVKEHLTQAKIAGIPVLQQPRSGPRQPE